MKKPRKKGQEPQSRRGSVSSAASSVSPENLQADRTPLSCCGQSLQDAGLQMRHIFRGKEWGVGTKHCLETSLSLFEVVVCVS